MHSAMPQVRTSNLTDGGHAVREHASADDQVVYDNLSDDGRPEWAIGRAIAQDDRRVLAVGAADAGQVTSGDG